MEPAGLNASALSVTGTFGRELEEKDSRHATSWSTILFSRDELRSRTGSGPMTPLNLARIGGDIHGDNNEHFGIFK